MITRLTLAPIIHWKGQWVEGTAYKKNAVVANDGSTFIANIANPATEPTVTFDAEHNTYTVSEGWGLVAYGSTADLAETVAEHRADQLRDEDVIAEHLAYLLEEIKGLASVVDNLGDARARSLSLDTMLQICGSKLILSGSGAPAIAPDFVGQIYEDISNKLHYVALGNASASDWVPVANKAVTDSLSSGKVDKVDGKGLSTEDYSSAEKSKLAGIAAGAQVNVLEKVAVDGTLLEISEKGVNIILSGKVDKVEGKALSTNDYDNDEKAKNAANKSRLDTIEVVIAEHLASIRAELLGFASVVDNLGDARARSLSLDTMLQICGSKLILSGSGAPSVIPDFIGQEYCDTTNKKSYKAFGNGSVSDWVALN